MDGSSILLGELRRLLDWRLRWVQFADLELIRAPAEREHAIDAPGTAQEHQPAGRLSSPAAGVDDRVHAGAVDELELAKIEHDQPRLQLRLAQRLLQPRHHRDVQSTGELHPSVRQESRGCSG